MAEYTIVLDRFDLAIRLGIHPHEAQAQRVRLAVAMTVTYPEPIDADRIEQVLDYDVVRAAIADLASERAFALQETLCDAVASLCLADSRVRRVKVSSTKLDIYPDARVGCHIVRERA